MAPTTILISGANRGLGKALLEHYLARPEHIVIAANRDPEHGTSKDLADLPKGSDSCLILVKIDATSHSDAPETVNELKKQGVQHLDLVIASAGVGYAFAKVSDVKITDMKAHIEPNVYGMSQMGHIRLERSIYRVSGFLLKPVTDVESVNMDSSFVSFFFLTLLPSSTYQPSRNPPPVPNAAYAPSKAAAHWLTKRMNMEEDKLTAFVVHPGWVQTDMGDTSARLLGFEHAPVKLEESIHGVLKLLDSASKESHGGKMWTWEGK
ncbi:hypothetical protein PMZ80_007125 [Knufia obscura]|nr:hypothetical protein PMZ80_007125 [Knufia obscura]